VGAFVDGSANFLKAMGLGATTAVALMGVLVASFAGTTMDTACRLQRYVVQELANTFSTGDKRPTGAANPLAWLSNKHGATIFAIIVAGFIAAMPKPGAALTWQTSGTGGLILWPLFGATNQLLAGLAFLVISFYLWRRRTPVWFIAIPMVFMLIMPAWAMLAELPSWMNPVNASGDPMQPNWVAVVIAIATVLLEAWMVIEAIVLWPRVKGVVEQTLPPLEPVYVDEAPTGVEGV
jgi:carbon starvation protein